MKKLTLAVLCGTIMGLTACGSDDDSNSNNTPPVTQPNEKQLISGTAAAGAPIVGQVTVKDAVGQQKTVDIEIDGKYTIDVTGMTAPFIFHAYGKVGGRDVNLVSAATSDDVNKTINITPFTDLIVANIAGQAAVKYFENPQFEKLTTEDLNLAKTTLTQRLLPILKDLNIADGFDLLRSAFKADHTGFDAVMDAVRVSVDENTNKALIKDVINQTQIEDDLASKTDNTILPDPVVPLAGATSDLQAISQQLTAFSALFSQGLPSVASLRPLFVSDGSFLQEGQDLETFLEVELLDPENKGIVLSSPVILKRISDTELNIRLQISEPDGRIDSDEWIFKKEGSIWKIKGNQSPVEQDIGSVNVRTMAGMYNNSETLYARKLESWVGYAPNNVAYIQITGPGLASPVLMVRQSDNWVGWGFVKSNNTIDPTTWLSECGQQIQFSPCVDFSKVGNDAIYTFQPLNINKEKVLTSYTKNLERPPVSNDDAKANANKWFASVVKITPQNYSTIQNGTNIAIEILKPSDNRYYFDSLSYGLNDQVVEVDGLTLDSKLANVTWSGNTPTTRPFINVWSYGEYGRAFVTLTAH
jgi:hypothetical protein